MLGFRGHHGRPRRHERLQLQGVEGQLLPRGDEARGDAPLLRGALPDRGGQQHVLPDAGRGPAAALGGRGPRRLHLRAEGLAAHHPHAAALPRLRRDRRLLLRQRPASSGSAWGPCSSSSRRTSRRTCRASRPSSSGCPRTGPPRSSSGTSPGSGTTCTTRCARRGPPSAPPTPTSRGDEGAPVVATASWGYLRLRRAEYGDADLAAWADRILAQPWERAFVFFKHEDAGKGPDFARRLLDKLSA